MPDEERTMSEERSGGQRLLLLLGIFVLAPPLLLFLLAGVDLVGNVAFSPFRFVSDAAYRQETQARWRQTGSMAREIGGLLPILILVLLTLCFYYAMYSLLMYHAAPHWMTRVFCFFAAHMCE
jgi:hypothetical protein